MAVVVRPVFEIRSRPGVGIPEERFWIQNSINEETIVSWYVDKDGSVSNIKVVDEQQAQRALVAEGLTLPAEVREKIAAANGSKSG